MKVTFWGVRGSIPVPGAETARWGGNSSCVELTHDDLPPLVLDCGTGVRGLGMALARRKIKEVQVLFSHLHVDHVFGFPFFLPLFTPGARVGVGVPAYSADEARERLGRYLNGTFHPVKLRDLPAQLDFHGVRTGRTLDLDGWTVVPARLNHPGGALGYRVSVGGRSFAYVTDTAPFAKPGEGVAAGEQPTASEVRMVEFLRGCELVAYDTMYDRGEYLEKMTWGHSYPEYAIALCRAAGVKQLLLYHHLPDATDDDLDAREARYAEERSPRVRLAREGETIALD